MTGRDTPANADGPLLFAPRATRAFGERVAAALGSELGPLEEREFEGGEHKTRPLVSVRGRQVFLLQSLSGDEQGSANDRLCRLLFLAAGIKDSGAARVTACLPYLAYARKDRRTKERDPVTQRYVAQLFEASGVDHVIALDVHNLAAFENAFRCPVDQLEAAPMIARHFATEADRAASLTVVSPDIGGAKRAQRLQELLALHTGREIGFAVQMKRRSSGVVSGDLLAGDVSGRRVVIVDDLIGAGTTMLRAVHACRAAGAVAVDVVATHGVFTPESARLLEADGPDRLFVTDSILPTRLGPGSTGRAPIVLPASALFAEAIRRIMSGGSVVALRELEPGRR